MIMAYPSRQKASGPTPEDIVKDVRSGDLKPVYILMGEESYYIDRISDYIVSQVLKPEERDFNLLTFFGPDSQVSDVINAAKGFPMGAQRLVVVVKEAQGLSGIDKLEFYLKNPQPSTILIVCYKNGTIDKTKKFLMVARKVGVVFESKKLRDYQLPPFITSYLRRKGLAIDSNAAGMMAEYIGPDLNRMAGELDKLSLAMKGGAKTVTVDVVAENIGVSKDFNIFELQDAIVRKNVLKANLITNYFDSNPKANPIQKTLPVLFRLFSNVMLAYYSPDKSEHGIATWLNQTDWQVRQNILPAMKNYSGVKVMKIIGEIRRTDARSKGVGNPSIPSGELMRELIFFILH